MKLGLSYFGTEYKEEIVPPAESLYHLMEKIAQLQGGKSSNSLTLTIHTAQYSSDRGRERAGICANPKKVLD